MLRDRTGYDCDGRTHRGGHRTARWQRLRTPQLSPDGFGKDGDRPTGNGVRRFCISRAFPRTARSYPLSMRTIPTLSACVSVLQCADGKPDLPVVHRRRAGLLTITTYTYSLNKKQWASGDGSALLMQMQKQAPLRLLTRDCKLPLISDVTFAFPRLLRPARNGSTMHAIRCHAACICQSCQSRFPGSPSRHCCSRSSR